MIFPHTLSDALRRLLVVIGCVVLATAQPMSAFGASSSTEQPPPNLVIDPSGSSGTPASAGVTRLNSGYGGTSYVVFAAVLAAAGGWVLWKKKGGIVGLGSAATRKLLIEESRSLGNRQHLVVASYQGRRFLLGVTTGRIELLTHLSDDDFDPASEDVRK